jgi:hypothetical protein
MSNHIKGELMAIKKSVERRIDKRANEAMLAKDPDAVVKKLSPNGHNNIAEFGKATRFKPGVSGNPSGRPKGSKNKNKNTGATVAEAFAELNDRLMSNGEMLAAIAEKALREDTMTGLKIALECVKEANKYIEPTMDAKEASKLHPIEDISSKEIEERLLRIVNEE